MDLHLTDKPVIVCAATSGLGKATALEFAREGARVMIASRREAEVEKVVAEIKTATGGEVAGVAADMTKAADIARLVEATVARFGGVYALINNSGGPPAGTFDAFDDAAWQSAFELNLLGYVRAIRAALPHMRAAGGGRVVNYTSSSIKSPIENLILSNTFRMGVLGMAKTLAAEVGRDGVLVNVVGPGRIQTPRIEQLDEMVSGKTGRTVEDVRAENFRSIPVGRYGTPEEFAKIAVFLGSPANSYITGQALLVDGGMTRVY